MPESVYRRVIVVGSGLAGLCFAHEYKKLSGEAPLVLEGSSEIGGRVKSLVKSGQRVELGAELIGANHWVWKRLAKEFRIALVPSNSHFLQDPILDEQEEIPENEGLNIAYREFVKQAREVRLGQPWRTKNARELDLLPLSKAIERLPCEQSSKELLRAQLTSNFGQETERISLLAFLLQIKAGGLEKYFTQSEAYRAEGGTQRLSESLANSLGWENIRLNTVVKTIFLSARGVEIISAEEKRFKCEQIILAVPAALWPEIEIYPPVLKNIILQTGHVSKVSAVAWGEEQKVLNSINPRGPFQQIWSEHSEAEKSLITGFAGGKKAQELNRASESKRLALFNKELTSIEPHLSGAISHAYSHNWDSAPLIRGAYSCPAPGEITLIWPRLRRLGRLHVIGEALSGLFGYMEGALQSGYWAARRLAKLE